MARLKSHISVMIFMMAAFILSAGSAHAVLTVRDLNNPGDGLITFDSKTNLEWLDVPATLGSSYNTNLGSVFVQSQGFNYANASQLARLYIDAGIPGVVQTPNPQGGVLTVDLVPELFESVTGLINLLGATTVGSNADVLVGILDFDPINPLQVNFSELLSVPSTMFDPVNRGAFKIGDFPPQVRAFGFPNIGSLLNRFVTSPDNPVLPTSIGPDGAFKFKFPVTAGETFSIDPPSAIGYDYETGAGDPNFASVLLPSFGDDLYDLFLFDEFDAVFDTLIDIAASTVFDFTTGLTGFGIGTEGISKFRILGIEASAGLSPFDTEAFVTGLTFVTDGQFTGTQTPIVESAMDVAAVPEPGTLALFGFALTGLGFLRRRRRR